jgi:intracellular sulfur oxidation DsrE/DsrF family protein
MKRVIATLLLIPFILFAKYDFKDPKPTFDHPREIIMKLNKKDKEYANHLLGTIYNILKEYPSDSLKVVVIAYGPGMRVLKKDYDKKTLSRISSLMDYDVEFVGCINTMQTMGWKKKDFIDDIRFVQAGVVEVIEKQAHGFIDATPY